MLLSIAASTETTEVPSAAVADSLLANVVLLSIAASKVTIVVALLASVLDDDADDGDDKPSLTAFLCYNLAKCCAQSRMSIFNRMADR